MARRTHDRAGRSIGVSAGVCRHIQAALGVGSPGGGEGDAQIHAAVAAPGWLNLRHTSIISITLHGIGSNVGTLLIKRIGDVRTHGGGGGEGGQK